MNVENSSFSDKPLPIPDSIIGLTKHGADGLGSLICFIIDSVFEGSDCYVDIDCKRFEAEITQIEALAPSERLDLAMDILSYLRLLTHVSQALPH